MQDEFSMYIKNVQYFLGRKLTTAEILFEVSEHFENGQYAEECAQSLISSRTTLLTV